MSAKVRRPKIVTTREDFIDHIQRVEAYINGASLEEVEQETLPEHLQDPDVAAYAAALCDELAVDEIKEFRLFRKNDHSH